MMKAVKFSQIGKKFFLISWSAGTAILLLFLIQNHGFLFGSDFIIWLSPLL